MLHHNRAEPVGSVHKGGDYACVVHDGCGCVCTGSFIVAVGDGKKAPINSYLSHHNATVQFHSINILNSVLSTKGRYSSGRAILNFAELPPFSHARILYNPVNSFS